jgi:hypothetical protein
MSLRRWQLVVLILGIAVAGFLPTLAFSSSTSTRSTTTIGLVIGTQTTTLSESQLETVVTHLTGSKLRSATIVLSVNGQIKGVGSAASYKAFMLRAREATAENLIRSMLPDVESYNADNVGTSTDIDRNAATHGYAGMTITILRHRYDSSLPAREDSVVRSARTTYCVQATFKGETASKNGPAAPIKAGRCSVAH